MLKSFIQKYLLQKSYMSGSKLGAWEQGSCEPWADGEQRWIKKKWQYSVTYVMPGQQQYCLGTQSFSPCVVDHLMAELDEDFTGLILQKKEKYP